MKSITLLFLLITSVLSASAITLLEAAKNPNIKISIHGADHELFDGKDIQINVRNLRNDALEITAEPGFVFASDESDVQDMILVEPLMIVLLPKSEKSVGVSAMCIESSNKSPHFDSQFDVGYNATGNLLKASQFIYKNGYINSMGQDAMWAISDGESVYDITGPPEIANPLRVFIADLLNIAFDTSLINKNEIYVPRSIKEYALFLKFYLKDTDDIKLQLFDHKGDHVRDLLTKDNAVRGEYNFKYKVALYGLIGQKYYVRLFVGDDMRTEFPLLIKDS